MVEQNNQGSQVQFLLSDFNTRLKDLEERQGAIRERVLLLGKNLISSKEEINNETEATKKQLNKMQTDLEKLKSFSDNFLEELNKFVKRDEVIPIERMLKDFQPLKFVREKDLDRIIKEKLSKAKTK